MEVDLTSNVRRRATVLGPKLLLKTPGKTRVSLSVWLGQLGSKQSKLCDGSEDTAFLLCYLKIDMDSFSWASAVRV